MIARADLHVSSELVEMPREMTYHTCTYTVYIYIYIFTQLYTVTLFSFVGFSCVLAGFHCFFCLFGGSTAILRSAIPSASSSRVIADSFENTAPWCFQISKELAPWCEDQTWLTVFVAIIM